MWSVRVLAVSEAMAGSFWIDILGDHRPDEYMCNTSKYGGCLGGVLVCVETKLFVILRSRVYSPSRMG